MKNLEYRLSGMIFLMLFLFSSCSQIEFLGENTLKSTPSPLIKERLVSFSQSVDQQAIEKVVDILVVVDNSTSMREDQEKLSRGFESFVSSISNANYRIGVVTTDTDSENTENTEGYHGNLAIIEATGKRFIEKSDANPSQLFSELIKRDETTDCGSFWNVRCASSHERPLYAIKMAIDKRNTVNSGFFREGADIGVVIITDEDETNFSNGTYYSAQDLFAYFENEFKGSKKINAFTIAILQDDSTCYESQADEVQDRASVSYGVRIGELAVLTGGFSVSICDENFSSSLNLISNYMEKNLLPLKIKVPKTIVLKSINLLITELNGDIFETNYIIENHVLRISPMPPEGAQIDLEYSFKL